MRFIRSFFFDMNPVWTIGVPFFTLFFFLPYWFILCPIICHRKHEAVGTNCSWNSPWLYFYWLAAAVIWVIVFSTAVYCWRQNYKDCNESDLGCDQYLLSSQHCKKPVPFRLISLSGQHNYCIPTKKKANVLPQVIPLQTEINGDDISCIQGQSPMLTTIPSSRPSQSDFTWDDEEISWLGENEETTLDSSLREIVPEPHVEMILDNIYLANSPQEPEGEDLQQDFEFLAVEHRSVYYQLTPTGSPPDSPSFKELSSTESKSELEMEDGPNDK